jgi:hypothetical protein
MNAIGTKFILSLVLSHFGLFLLATWIFLSGSPEDIETSLSVSFFLSFSSTRV